MEISQNVLKNYSVNPPNVYGFGHKAYYDHTVYCIENNKKQLVDGLEGRKSLELLTDAELIDLMKLVNKTKANIDKKLKPHGYNIGLNIGKVGGAGFAGHIHIHVVPRWVGDTNFMPVTGNAKVMAESLEAMRKLLKG